MGVDSCRCAHLRAHLQLEVVRIDDLPKCASVQACAHTHAHGRHGIARKRVALATGPGARRPSDLHLFLPPADPVASLSPLSPGGCRPRGSRNRPFEVWWPKPRAARRLPVRRSMTPMDISLTKKERDNGQRLKFHQNGGDLYNLN